MLVFTKEQIKEISEQLDCGFRAFYNKETGALLFVPDTDKHYDIAMSAWREELDILDENFSNFQEIYAMDASDSFKVMTGFIELVSDIGLQEKLVLALHKRKPFREFKYVIGNSLGYRQSWFDYKNKKYFEWTENQLKSQV